MKIVCGYRQRLFYEGLRKCLLTNKDIPYDILGYVSYSKDLRAAITNQKPSIVITSTLYDGWPLPWLLEMRDKLYPQMKVVVLTFNTDVELMLDATSRGVDGYLYKSDSCEEIHKCLRIVLSGEKYIKRFVPTNQKGSSLTDLQ